ncbi:TPA: GIY-YIG nuclease family protein [Photobacterium damselae]
MGTLHVVITPNLKAFQVRNANHVIYAHQSPNGDVYIGQAQCIVNRWAEHNHIANSLSHPESHQKFKVALRTVRHWNHYIVAIADTQGEADIAEASAIKFYKPSLNMHVGRSTLSYVDYNFQPLNGDGRETVIEGKQITRYQTQERFSDRERSTILCRAIRKVGKSHISFECISDGMRVNVSHAKRVGFREGDRVTISHAAKGKSFYTTTDYSDIKKV